MGNENAYLIRIHLDPGKYRTLQALNAPCMFHGALEEAFGYNNERKIWRIDNFGNNYYMLICCSSIPDTANIVSQFGFDDEEPVIGCYTQFLNSIKNNDKYRFRINANPTHKRDNNVYALYSHSDQLEWLRSKGCGNGFEIEKMSIVKTDSKTFNKKGNITVTFNETTYDGVLRVTDCNKFKHALLSGIGREKAYGEGMMTITTTSIR